MNITLVPEMIAAQSIAERNKKNNKNRNGTVFRKHFQKR